MENVSRLQRLKSFIVEQKCIPWGVSNRYELFMERQLYFKSPLLYRLLKYGRIRDICTPLTRAPGHHFFGYYEKTPWNSSGKLILCHGAAFNDRPPLADDSVKVGFTEVSRAGEFIEIGCSFAWNWQQGSMLQWDPAEPEGRIFYNDRRGGSFVAIRRSLENHTEDIFERPVYAISPKGNFAFSLNFSRLQKWRPGYGYAGVPDAFAGSGHPEDDGIFRMDLKSGKSDLIISLDQLARKNTLPGMLETTHWINHIQVSPNGNRIAFFHIWQVEHSDWRVRFYIVCNDGSDLRCILDTGDISHYDWRDEKHILVWAKDPNGPGTHFLICDIETGNIEIFGEHLLNEDGHCSYSPDRKWILNDTYPDRHNMRTLMLIREEDMKKIELNRFYSPKERWWGEIRCDLHPRWNRDGTQVCIDSVHNGERQMYLIDLKGTI